MNTYRSRSGGYRGTGGYGGGGFTLTFPPFVGAVKALILANVAMYFARLILGVAAPRAWFGVEGFTALIPTAVLHGYVWQIVTYAFLHVGIWHILGNMLQLWFFGTPLEADWGRKRFYEFYFFTLIGAALTTIAVSYTGWFGVTPLTPTEGASGAIFAVLVAFAMLYGEQQVMLFPIPISIKAKYLVIILILVNLAGALGAMQAGHGEAIAYAAHLGGAFFGWFYVKFLPRQGLRFLASERYYGVRNSYYRWKRRRAAKKFEVYMRKQDRKDYFDQYGNYRPPDKDKENGGPWVN